MINKEIIINKKTRKIVNGENGDLFRLGVDSENLQENIIFKFEDEFVNGTARIEIIMQNETKSYVMINKVNETYVLPVKSILTKKGLNKMQLVITQGTDDEEIPIFKSEMFNFFIAESINADTEQPEEYPQWIDKANTTLNEIDNFDIDAVKELNEATITITDRTGLEKSVKVYDGKDAKINGLNTLNLLAGNNITIEQEDDELTISAEGGGSGGGAVNSVNGMTGDVVIDIPDVSNFITKDVNNLTNYEPKSSTANNLVATIDSSTYIMTLTLRNSNNQTLNSQTIDLPLETMVVGGSYDSTNKKIVLTLKNGQTLEFSVADLVSGLQSEITSSSKLSSDLVDDTSSTNKFVSANDITNWNAKSEFSGSYNDLTNKPDLNEYQTKYRVNNATTRFNFDTEKLGVYTFSGESTSLYYKANNYDGSIANTIPLYIFYTKLVSEATTNEEVGKLIYINNSSTSNNANRGVIYKCSILQTQNEGVYLSNKTALTGDTKARILLATQQQIDGVKTFNSTPKLTSYSAPSSDEDLVAKKYVDDKFWIGTQAQYDLITTKDPNVLYFIQEE